MNLWYVLGKLCTKFPSCSHCCDTCLGSWRMWADRRRSDRDKSRGRGVIGVQLSVYIHVYVHIRTYFGTGSLVSQSP